VADVADEVAARQDSYQSAVSDHRQASDPPRQHGLGGGLQRGDLIGGNDGAGHHVIDGLTGLAEYVGLRDDAEDVLLIVHDRHTGDAVVDDDSHGLVDAVARVDNDNARNHHVSDGGGGVVDSRLVVGHAR
jgi:hypothetical protein